MTSHSATRIAAVTGAMLLIASMPLLVAQWREATTERRAYRRYSIEMNGPSATLNGRSLSMFRGAVIVDGHRQLERFGPDGTVLLIQDHTTGERELIGIERSRDGRSYRRVVLEADREAVAQTFTLDGKTDQLGVLAARLVTPTPVPFTNRSLQYWPGALYPILYPWLTGAVGVLLLIAAIGAHMRFAPKDA